jgi:ParB family chromosome partitioning protein
MAVRTKISNVKVREGWNFRSDLGDVQSLADSIARVGILQPIIVNKRWEVIAGHRRLEAAKMAGLEEVPVEMDDREDESVILLAHIDENLERRDLEGADLDRALAVRKKIYEKLNPASAKIGRAKEKARIDGEETKTFAQDTAEKTGMAERTVQQSIRRAEGAAPEVMAAYEAGQLKKKQVDALVKLDPETQAALLPNVIGKSAGETAALVDAALDDTAGRGGAGHRAGQEGFSQRGCHAGHAVHARGGGDAADDLRGRRAGRVRQGRLQQLPRSPPGACAPRQGVHHEGEDHERAGGGQCQRLAEGSPWPRAARAREASGARSAESSCQRRGSIRMFAEHAVVIKTASW